MPYRPNTPCRHPGCAALVPYGQKYCEKHKALHPEEVRSATKREYGRKWQKFSKAYLQTHQKPPSIIMVSYSRRQGSVFIRSGG